MSSTFAFPAFERAQNEHMGARDSFMGSSLIGGAAGSLDLGQATAQSATPAKPVITKRMNARLQLAAALIEADNDNILEKADRWNSASEPGAPRPPPPPEPKLASQSAIFAPFRADTGPKLPHHARTYSNASRLSRMTDERRPSVDFLGVSLPTEKQPGSRAGSIGMSGRRSCASSLFVNGETVGRPSMASRAGSVFAATEASVAGEDALNDWGVERFLSKEERERIAFRKRNRANSVAGFTTNPTPSAPTSDLGVGDKWSSFSSRKSLDISPATPGAALGAGKARSEIIQASTGSNQNSHMDLLARIKLYRERQENLPPSQWDGPGPTASKEEVVEHITGMSPTDISKPLDEGTSSPIMNQSSGSVLDRPHPHSRSGSFSSTRKLEPVSKPVTASWTRPIGAQAKQEVEKVVSLEKRFEREMPVSTSFNQRHLSTAGILGDSWLDQEQASDVGDVTAKAGEFPSSGGTNAAESPSAPPAPGITPQLAQPVAAAAPGGFSLATADQLEHAFGRKSPAPAVAIQEQQRDPLDELADGEMGMAGIGSYTRSQSRRNSMLGMAPVMTGIGSGPGSPQLMPSRPGTPSAFFGMHMALPDDPFSNLPLGPGPFPTGFPASPNARLMDLQPPTALTAKFMVPTSPVIRPVATVALSTKQLQAIARNSTFPEHFGINNVVGGSNDDELRDGDADEFGNAVRTSVDAADLSEQLTTEDLKNLTTQLGGGVPDLSSANWGKPKKKWFRVSMLLDPKKSKKASKAAKEKEDAEADEENDTTAAEEEEVPEAGAATEFDHMNDNDDRPLGLGPRRDLSESYAAEPVSTIFEKLRAEQEQDDVDDDYISPPRKGPLRPRGMSSRLPKTLTMPQPLQGTKLAPKIRLTEPDVTQVRRQSQIYVPDGFVLHDGKGLPPMRSLQVTSATGPKPLFASAGGDNRLEELVSDIKSIEVTRTLRVPAAAPNGIGRRAAVPTTALFRNQLVQHEEDQEGWGWEAGTRTEDAFVKADGDSSDSDAPLADIKKKSRAAKRAAKKLAKEKRKRKEARRVRRTKREQALAEGKSFEDLGVGELSPDEDLDLSSTTSGSEQTEYETETESWASDDDKRWVDDSKPAGKLFGKSLLDIAQERNETRISKARYYGQVQLEDEERAEREKAASTLGAPAGAGDAASVAPSVARTFHENPLGYNDTRERMEATFGTDLNWAREMEKRRAEEVKEKEEAEIARLAEEEFRKEEEARKKRKKDKRIFRKNKSKGKMEATMADSSAQVMQPSTPNPETAENTVDESGRVSPPRSKTPVNAPVIDLTFGSTEDAAKTRRNRKGPSEEAAQWFVQSSDEEDTEYSSSEDEAERRRQAMQRVRLSRSLGGTAESKLLAAAIKAEDDSSSDDNLPLAQIKKNVASRPISYANGLNVGASAADDSSDEELPLAAFKAKRQQEASKLGRLDLDFGGGAEQKSVSLSPSPSHLSSPARADGKGVLTKSSLLSNTWKPEEEGEEDDSDEDVPLGMRHPNGAVTLLASKPTASDEEDDQPLGASHPQAAIIAEQAALIRQLQAEKEQQSRASYMPMPMPWNMPPAPSMLGFGMPPAPVINIAATSPQAPVGFLPPVDSPMMLDPKASTIHNWRQQVPLDATAGTPPGSGSAVNSST